MPPDTLRTIRTLLRYGVYAVCLFACLSAIGIVGFAMMWNPFEGFDGKVEFADLSGPEAATQMKWIDGVDASRVARVSCKHEFSRDGSSTWSRVELPPDLAETWRTKAHQAEENWSGTLSQKDQRVEGIHRTFAGPIPAHASTGDAPAWWSPPEGDVRATEIMVWTMGHTSGASRAIYSLYDVQHSILWIDEHTAQHEKLWPAGHTPTGRPIASQQHPPPP